MTFCTLSIAMNHWDYHIYCWQYKDRVPDPLDKILRDMNPYQLAVVFKITYECYIVLVDWLVEKSNKKPSWETPWCE